MMKNLAVAAAFAAGANALVPRSNTCCFGLTASGSVSGTIGQLSDGQNRIGGGLPAAQYCIDSSGGITDSNGRGCILTPPTTQFQCDSGAKPTTGFSISSSGTVEYNGSSQFYACETGDNGELNIYYTTSSAETGCKPVTLHADSCKSGGGSSSAAPVPASSVAPQASSAAPESTSAATPAPAPESSAAASPAPASPAPAPESSAAASPAPESSAPVSPAPAPESSAAASPAPAPASSAAASPAPTPESSAAASPAPKPSASASPAPAPESSVSPSASSPAPQPSSSSSSGGCGTTLQKGSYEYPHLIIPIDSSAPSKASGTSYNGTVTSTISSLFNFDIPSSDSGKQCSLVFLFPEKKDLETSSFSFSGNGEVRFSSLDSPAQQSTSYSNAPGVKSDLGTFTVSPGHNYTISTFTCPAGQTVAYEISNAGSTDLNYFQDYNPSPIGLYITTC
ncbi:hypothetical protein DTO271G3_1909 [Paecilomyces variotii]|nr:hypothetical protein DTO271G3_1909 [Paecilomyces variotii]